MESPEDSMLTRRMGGRADKPEIHAKELLCTMSSVCDFLENTTKSAEG